MVDLYCTIVKAIKAGVLIEPFRAIDIRKACPGFADNTYSNFLPKHRLGNGRTSELFERIASGKYRCLRPFLHGN